MWDHVGQADTTAFSLSSGRSFLNEVKVLHNQVKLISFDERLQQYGSQHQSRLILPSCSCVQWNVNTPGLIYSWYLVFPWNYLSNYIYMYFFFLGEGANWMKWIIRHPQWALFGFVVVTRLTGPCSLIYEWCIRRSNQEETKRLGLPSSGHHGSLNWWKQSQVVRRVLDVKP